MKNIVFLIFLIFSALFFAQSKSDDKMDKIVDEMCSNLKQSENLSDAVRIKTLQDQYIVPYLSEFPDTKRKGIAENLIIRFQKRCEYFREYLSKVNRKQNDHWIKLDKRPDITVTDEEISQLKNTKSLYYFESSGKKTLVKTDSKFWIETFTDKTNSKLFYNWTGKNKFELEFIKSSNNARKNFSRKGDKYINEVISKENDFYWILATIPRQSALVKFRLFTE